MELRQRLTRNISFKLLAEMISRSFSFIFFIAMTRILGDVGYGQYAFVVAFTGLFNILMDCGVNTMMIRDIAQNKDADRLKLYMIHVVWLKIVLSVITWGSIMATIRLLSYPEEVIKRAFWGALMMIGSAWIETICAFFNGIERIDQEIWVKLAHRILGTGLGIGILFAQGEVWMILKGVSIGYLISIFVALGVLRKHINQTNLWNFQWPFFQWMIKESLPFWAAGFFVLLYFRVDTVMLSLFGHTDAEIGWYYAIVKLVEVISLVPYLIAMGMYPVFVDLDKTSPEQLKFLIATSLKYLFLLAVPIVIGGIILAEPIVISLFGVRFLPSVPIFQMLLWTLVFIFMNFVIFCLLAAIQQQRLVVFITGFSFILNLFLNLFMIPAWGYLGAGGSTVITDAIAWSLSLYFLVSRLKIESLPFGLLRGLGCGFFMGFFTYVTTYIGFPWFAIVPLAAFLYGLSLYGFRVIRF